MIMSSFRAGGTAACLLLTISSCSHPTEPTIAEPTLLVRNPFCQGSACRSVDIFAYVRAWPIPQSPRGNKRVGTFDTPTACFRLGPAWTLTIRGVDSTGASLGDSASYTWTPDDPRGIFVTASTQTLFAFGQTENFVPATAPGWELSFTEGSAHDSAFLDAHLAPAEQCQPDDT